MHYGAERAACSPYNLNAAVCYNVACHAFSYELTDIALELIALTVHAYLVVTLF